MSALRQTVAGACVAAALAAQGCASTFPASGPVTLAPSPSTTTKWDAEVALATRRVEPYHWAVRQADMRATLITPRLRKVFATERGHFHGRFAGDTARILLAFGSVDEGVDADKTIARPEGEEEILVFVAMYVTDQRFRDLSIAGTIWDTSLVRGSQRVKPLRIEAVRKSPAVAEVFGYVDRFDDLYLVHFPLVDVASGFAPLAQGTEPLRLEVSSGIATCAVSWTLNDGDG